MLEEGETRAKKYLLALQTQDISPAASEEESSVSSELKIDDIEGVIDRERTLSANVQFMTADFIIYTGVGCENDIDGEDLEL